MFVRFEVHLVFISLHLLQNFLLSNTLKPFFGHFHHFSSHFFFLVCNIDVCMYVCLYVSINNWFGKLDMYKCADSDNNNNKRQMPAQRPTVHAAADDDDYFLHTHTHTHKQWVRLLFYLPFVTTTKQPSNNNNNNDSKQPCQRQASADELLHFIFIFFVCFVASAFCQRCFWSAAWLVNVESHSWVRKQQSMQHIVTIFCCFV